MRDRIIKKLKKNWIVLWLTAVVILLGGIAAFAAYTRTSSIKRVVSTRSGASVLFSSNYLQLGSTAFRNVSFGSDSDNPVIKITVCNYAQGNKFNFNAEDITYSLTAELVDKDGNTLTDFSGDGYYIKYENGEQKNFSGSHLTYSFENQTLSTGGPSEDTYSISFNKTEFSSQSVFMKITAKPTSPTDLEPISAIIGVSYRKADVANWTGEFVDNVEKPSELDGFNYRISGSGNGTITLSWNTNYVKLGKWSYGKFNLTEDGNVSTVTFKVDSSENNQYNIQFYRTVSPNESEVWTGKKENVSIGENKFITFAFTADTSS